MWTQHSAYEGGNCETLSGSKRTRIIALGLALAGGALLMVNGATDGANNAESVVKSAAATSSVSGDGIKRITRNGDEGVRRILVAPEIDRAQVENLQRWVAAGHEEWCKDPRLVAAEEMRRLATDFAEGGATLNLLGPETESNHGARVKTFEWVPADGRAVYRVTVERFEWLEKIAEDAESIVWVPTLAEILIQDDDWVPELHAGVAGRSSGPPDTVLKELVG